MIDSFYREFEDQFRGSRELVKNRLAVYLPFISCLKEISDKNYALDLGCGRGEWLEILVEQGFIAKGADLDEGMLIECDRLGLSVERQDALAALKAYADESLVLISGFHIAEHLSFEVLRQLIVEAYRVLKPGGLLILETPNAENVVVGSNLFYLDPTHHNPIPSALLQFLVSHSGFHRTKILRLQGADLAANGNQISLANVFYDVSPDYSVIAQKKMSIENQLYIDELVPQDLGNSLDFLLAKYEESLNEKFGEISAIKQAVIHELMEEIHQVTHLKNTLISKLEFITFYEQGIDELSKKLSGSYEQGIEELDKKLSDSYQQRITDLDRKLRESHEPRIVELERKISLLIAAQNKSLFKTIKVGMVAWSTFKPGSRPRRSIKLALNSVRYFVERHPKLRTLLLLVIKRIPKLDSFFKKYTTFRGPVREVSSVSENAREVDTYIMTPKAKEIFLKMKENIENNKVR
tara:strand:+ start:2646 stop:4043 length:1398 start_codon:yes stop_codon:yes gene_type:complete